MNKKTYVVIGAICASVIISVVTIAALTITGGFLAQKSADQGSILQVLNRQESSAKNRLAKDDHHSDWRGYVEDIKSIDAEHCPADFRVAWFDYISSCIEFRDHPVIATLSQSKHPSEKLRQVRRIAVKYGISFHEE